MLLYIIGDRIYFVCYYGYIVKYIFKVELNDESECMRLGLGVFV